MLYVTTTRREEGYEMPPKEADQLSEQEQWRIRDWIDADQSTGRVLHIPNGRLFREPMANFTLTRAIAAPPEVVFDTITDHPSYPEFTPIRMDSPRSRAQSTTARTFFSLPMLPGFIRKPSAPALAGLWRRAASRARIFTRGGYSARKRPAERGWERNPDSHGRIGRRQEGCLS